MIEGWRRLKARGRFVQPKSSAEALQHLEDLSSPVGAFVREQCELEPLAKVEVGELYKTWQGWCEVNGRNAGNRQTFGRDLQAAAQVAVTQRRVGGDRARFYLGIKPCKP